MPQAKQVSVQSLAAIICSLLAVPLVLLIIWLTEGKILPHFPGRGDTWNIQYFLPGGTGLLMATLLIVFRNRVAARRWFLFLVMWNLLFVAASVYATVTLWGEKF